MAVLGLTEFTDSTTAAAKLALEKGISFDEAFRQITADKDAKNQEDALKRMEQKQMMDNTIAKMAKLGKEDKANMPAVDVTKVRESDIPTGYLEFVDPKKLKPIYSGSDDDKIKSIANSWSTSGKSPVLISKDNWIIDGQSTVRAAILKNKWVRAIRINLPGKKALEAVKNLNNKH